jgi:hypothetical protein
VKVKVGLIGAGRRPNGYGIGQFVAREVLNCPLSDLIAIMGTNSKSLRQTITELNNKKDVMNKFEGAIYTIDQNKKFFNNSKIDLVIICSPSKTHEEYIRKAIMAGKHVLVEKPLLYRSTIPFKERLQKAHDLVKTADSKGLFLATNCQRAAIFKVLCDKLGFPSRTSLIDIKLQISSRGGKIKTPKDLFELTITHPLSLLVKYGLTNFESMRVKNYSQKFYSDSSYFVIKGIYNSKIKDIAYRIKVRQTKDISFASMTIKLDNKPPVKITVEKGPDGKLQAKYVTSDENYPAIYTEDNLKTSITLMINAIYYKGKNYLPLITNYESYYIYSLQEKLRELILFTND